MEKQHFRNLMLFFYAVFALLFCNKSVSQTTESVRLLKQKFVNADSIVLISHHITEEYSAKIIPDWGIDDTSMNLQKWEALHPVPPKFLINGKLNRQIIQESVSLNDSNKTRLLNILLRKVVLKHWTPLMCDQPQHSIIFYNGNIQSFIDICFGCHRVHSSKDIDFDEMNVDNKKWAALLAFFKWTGITKVFQVYERLMNK